MCLLHKPSISRVLDSYTGGEKMLPLFETLAADAELNNIPALTLVIPFIEEGDEYKTGSYVPELHLIVRRVEDD